MGGEPVEPGGGGAGGKGSGKPGWTWAGTGRHATSSSEPSSVGTLYVRVPFLLQQPINYRAHHRVDGI